MAGIRCRCRRCGARHTLRAHPDRRERRLRCPQCRRIEWTPKRPPRAPTHVWRVDRYRSMGKESRGTCYCIGYPFPHAFRNGWCVHGKERSIEEQEARFGPPVAPPECPF